MPRQHKRRRVVVVEELDDSDGSAGERGREAEGQRDRESDHERQRGGSSAASAGDSNSEPASQRADRATERPRADSSAADTAATLLVDWTFRDVDSYAIAKSGRAQLEAELDTKLSSLTCRPYSTILSFRVLVCACVCVCPLSLCLCLRLCLCLCLSFVSVSLSACVSVCLCLRLYCL
eukprot:COSAG03_NODE_4126_length_1674_cov_4.563810_2_plen_178_part_00